MSFEGVVLWNARPARMHLSTAPSESRTPGINEERRRPESNRRIKVLQTSALPLGYAALSNSLPGWERIERSSVKSPQQVICSHSLTLSSRAPFFTGARHDCRVKRRSVEALVHVCINTVTYVDSSIQRLIPSESPSGREVDGDHRV